MLHLINAIEYILLNVRAVKINTFRINYVWLLVNDQNSSNSGSRDGEQVKTIDHRQA